MANSVGLIDRLQDHWPDCADELTPEIRMAMEHGPGAYGAEARIKLERRRTELNEAMARIFDVAAGGVDFVITATQSRRARSTPTARSRACSAASRPGPRSTAGSRSRANLHGNPAISIPCRIRRRSPDRTAGRRPHFSEELLLDLALTVERNRPWPLTTRLTTHSVGVVG